MTPAEMDATIERKEIPASVQAVFRRAWAGGSRSASIKAFCLECQGYEKAAVRDCDVGDCPLWRHRPYQISRRARPGTPNGEISGGTEILGADR